MCVLLAFIAAWPELFRMHVLNGKNEPESGPLKKLSGHHTMIEFASDSEAFGVVFGLLGI